MSLHLHGVVFAKKLINQLSDLPDKDVFLYKYIHLHNFDYTVDLHSTFSVLK